MHLDQFESQFKSAVKTPYAYEAISLGSIALVCDGEKAASDALLKDVRLLVPSLAGHSEPRAGDISLRGFRCVDPRRVDRRAEGGTAGD